MIAFYSFFAFLPISTYLFIILISLKVLAIHPTLSNCTSVDLLTKAIIKCNQANLRSPFFYVNWLASKTISLYSHNYICVYPKCVSCSVMSDSLQPHGLWLATLLCLRNSPGKNTGVFFHCLLQWIFPTQRLNPGLLNCRQILYHLSHQGRLLLSSLCHFWVLFFYCFIFLFY